MADELKKIPPQNLEAEISLLGAILTDKEALLKIADTVFPEDFYKEGYKIIYETMLDLYNKREPIDILSLGNRLEEIGKLESVGGRSTLMNLANSVPSSAHIVHYAEIVHKKATLRRLITAGNEINKLGFNEEEELDTVLDRAEKEIFGVSQNFLKQSFQPLRNILTDAFDRIDELHREKGKLRGVPTGFSQLDNLLSGLQKSNLVILAARPSVGKTSLALDIARQVAVRAKVPVGIFSLEMSKEELADRLICAEAGVSLWKMRTGKLSERSDDDDFPKIGQAMGMLSDAPIFIDDAASANIMQIRIKARRLQAEHGLGLIMIDYLQLMESRTKTDNRVQEISEISRSLKGIARELNVPVLALSQLSRAVEMQNGPAIPKLAHLRESGSIEQDADVVLFIYRKAADRKYKLEDIPPDERHLAEIHIAKHRNGPTGIANLYFDEEKASFRSLDTSFSGHTSFE
ncbi:MAG: Replicative DNA helicase [Candidatus Magasanikbacteria bacterium GW2011_GWC2_40_17]|uniref:Replicative DNA helicase n=1 Tax=Candidatus Magasanikbacteria bacterium GW2011_GWA2_42_32 TaxID=1619039 RepID=A0A0G1CDX6_9BACT|nr:MAG: Replicative DNA helicase [Candidatus Magasanikbacteria bacterium GW2011_GWC2_40_17]KKS56906.1 MAG: Replicative DNA helicase [Candidatus Magasanikbacteria bacterium GW2011_GWA2_42_32]OGH85524.1 MAG: replicative DNA helicase [Candidatus Magasanikbacteria bacterium RIFOXYB2_FULL_38_10]